MSQKTHSSRKKKTFPSRTTEDANNVINGIIKEITRRAKYDKKVKVPDRGQVLKWLDQVQRQYTAKGSQLKRLAAKARDCGNEGIQMAQSPDNHRVDLMPTSEIVFFTDKEKNDIIAHLDAFAGKYDEIQPVTFEAPAPFQTAEEQDETLGMLKYSRDSLTALIRFGVKPEETENVSRITNEIYKLVKRRI